MLAALALIALGLALLAAPATAREAGGPPPHHEEMAEAGAEMPAESGALFILILDPAEAFVEVPLEVETLVLWGMSHPLAVVSVDGDVVDLDDHGTFVVEVPVDEGLNVIEIVASSFDDVVVETFVYVVRGDEP